MAGGAQWQVGAGRRMVGSERRTVGGACAHACVRACVCVCVCACMQGGGQTDLAHCACSLSSTFKCARPSLINSTGVAVSLCRSTTMQKYCAQQPMQHKHSNITTSERKPQEHQPRSWSTSSELQGFFPAHPNVDSGSHLSCGVGKPHGASFYLG